VSRRRTTPPVALGAAIGGVAVAAMLQQWSAGRQGTDDRARETVDAVAPTYERWVEPVRKNTPAQERWLFLLQGALGATVFAVAVHHLRRGGSRASE